MQRTLHSVQHGKNTPFEINSACRAEWLISNVVLLPNLLFFSSGPVRTTQNFVCLAKKSVNAKPFLVRTTFCTHQNVCKRNETSKIPSTSFGGCKNFVRRENPLFLDIRPSLGHQILQHKDYEANVTA